MSNQVLDLQQARINQIKRQNEADSNVSVGGKGFVVLYRKLAETSFYTDSEAVHLFIHFMIKATHKDIIVNMNGKDELLLRGQLITGRKKLVIETGIKQDRVRYLLLKLSRLNVISIKGIDNQYSIITILNYDAYQDVENEQKSQKKLPTDYQQITNANADTAKPSGEVLPTDYQQITTYNNITNISNTNVLDRSFCNDSQQQSESSKSDEPKKPQLRCEDVLKIFNQILPEISAKGLSEKRRQKIRRFWQQAKKIKNDLENTKGQPFTLNDWQSYLEYISERCRWMLEEKFNPINGTKWRKKTIDYILSEQLYLEVREGVRDDK